MLSEMRGNRCHSDIACTEIRPDEDALQCE